MKTISLTRGYVTKVDDEDFDSLSRYKWCVSGDRKYASSWIDGRRVYMHRFLKQGEGELDHVDGDGLNNQRSNLRVATSSQNKMNCRKRIGTSSEYKGVYWDKQLEKWRVRIQLNRKTIHLGLTSFECVAGRIYNFWAKQYYGPFAKLNILREV